MTDQELLQAISQMMDTKLAEQEQRTDAKFMSIKEDLGRMGDRLGTIEGRLETLETSVEEVRDSTNYIAEWVERLEDSFRKHEITTAG